MPIIRRIGLIGGLFTILATALLPATAAYAQSTPVRAPLELMTSPLPLNVTTKPGVPVTADIRVKNNGAQSEYLKVELLKFGAQGTTGQPQLQERGPKDLFFNWVTFSETTFTADPNVWKTIHMNINPPKEAAYGYYYAVLFSRANPAKGANGQSAVEGGVASLVLLNVEAPGTRRAAEIVGMQATHKVYEFLPASIEMKLHNNGNVHVIPTGTLFIKRGDTQVAAMDFNGEQGNILPGTDRVFSMDWNDGFPSYHAVKVGNKTKQQLSWDFGKIQKLRFGRYTATLVAVYDDGQRDVPIEAVVSFWVMPWRIIGAVLLIVLFVGGGLLAFMRLVWKNLKRRALAPQPVVPTDPTAAGVVPAEPAVPDNSLAAALRSSKSKKRSKRDRSPEKPLVEKVDEPADSASPEPATEYRRDSRQDERRKKQRRDKNASQSQEAARPAVVTTPAPEAPTNAPAPAEARPPRRNRPGNERPETRGTKPRGGTRGKHSQKKHGKRRHG